MVDQSPGYRVELTAPALRALSKLPPRVSGPLVSFIFGSLAENPKRRGKPLRGDLAGLWSARRADFRVVYQIDDQILRVYIIDVGHRAHLYRPR